VVHSGLKAEIAKEVPKLQSAHAILLLNGKFILQLRDNKPHIENPNKWSLFGGKIEKGEEPAGAIRREIFEELFIFPPEYRYLWFKDHLTISANIPARIWFFVANIEEAWDHHVLNEGSDVGSFSIDEIFYLHMVSVMREAIIRFHESIKTDQKAK
jgi:8-oxo-dGTP pyrophosphatase MutT (NUDIX family)